jgi:hypothetical protein
MTQCRLVHVHQLFRRTATFIFTVKYKYNMWHSTFFKTYNHPLVQWPLDSSDNVFPVNLITSQYLTCCRFELTGLLTHPKSHYNLTPPFYCLDHANLSTLRPLIAFNNIASHDHPFLATCPTSKQPLLTSHDCPISATFLQQDYMAAVAEHGHSTICNHYHLPYRVRYGNSDIANMSLHDGGLT